MIPHKLLEQITDTTSRVEKITTLITQGGIHSITIGGTVVRMAKPELDVVLNTILEYEVKQLASLWSQAEGFKKV